MCVTGFICAASPDLHWTDSRIREQPSRSCFVSGHDLIAMFFFFSLWVFAFFPSFFFFFLQTNPDGKVCLLSPSRDGTFPELTSNTKQQLLFHGCVQAEPGHLHWVTGLLAVFALSSKLCVFSSYRHRSLHLLQKPLFSSFALIIQIDLHN